MAIYSANVPNRTLVLHKQSCVHIPKSDLLPCGCGERGSRGNQSWHCEAHVSIREVSDRMRDRFWAVLLCGDCY